VPVGQADINKPCCPPKPQQELDAKKATIIRMRKYAKKVGEDRVITRAKIEAIRNHDLSLGQQIKFEMPDSYHIFSIRK